MSEGRAAVDRADEILAVALGVVHDGVDELEIGEALPAQLRDLLLLQLNQLRKGLMLGFVLCNMAVARRG